VELKDKVVVVTGSGRGIGRSMALAFASKGAHIALLDVNEIDLQHTAALCTDKGVRASTYLCNVAQEDEVTRTFTKVINHFSRLDVLINNAGILRDGLLIKADGDEFKTMSLAQWQAVIDVNLTGVFLCGREAAKHMAMLKHGGVIINISSISRAGNMGQSNYSAAKAGVASLTVVWAKELARYEIRTGAIAPGFIATEILNTMRPELLERTLQQVPLRRGGLPEQVAHSAIFIAENEYFSGRVIELDGGLRM